MEHHISTVLEDRAAELMGGAVSAGSLQAASGALRPTLVAVIGTQGTINSLKELFNHSYFDLAAFYQRVRRDTIPTA